MASTEGSARHRRRPPPAPVAGEFPLLDKAHGLCFLARQTALVFGSDRRQPVSWRPVVSLQREVDHAHVLPTTTQPDDSFFRLSPEDCLGQRARLGARMQYLCPRYELVGLEDLLLVGSLSQDLRVQIAHWLAVHRTRG